VEMIFKFFAEGFCYALGTGQKLSAHRLFAESNALGTNILFSQE
jgi:hypothetical protein